MIFSPTLFSPKLSLHLLEVAFWCPGLCMLHCGMQWDFLLGLCCVLFLLFLSLQHSGYYHSLHIFREEYILIQLIHFLIH